MTKINLCGTLNDYKTMTAQLILASASPRRKELLAQLGIQCFVKAVEIDETPLPNESPLDYVQRVAAEKSAACLAVYDGKLPILAADTSVVLNGQIMGKPERKTSRTRRKYWLILALSVMMLGRLMSSIMPCVGLMPNGSSIGFFL
jgi:hypothetical protein